MKQLKLKNYFLYSAGQGLTFQSFLTDLMLHGNESRQRTKFLKMISDKTIEVEQKRIEFGQTHCKKDKNGAFVFIDKDGKETTDKTLGKQFIIENQEGFNKELGDYLAQDYVIDITPANKETIRVVREIILKTSKEFSGQEAVQYNEWCEAFEQKEVK
jgi:hypothetical protein